MSIQQQWSGTLFRVPATNIQPEEYETLPTFAFSAYGYLFFTDMATAERFGTDVIVIMPEKELTHSK